MRSIRFCYASIALLAVGCSSVPETTSDSVSQPVVGSVIGSDNAPMPVCQGDLAYCSVGGVLQPVADDCQPNACLINSNYCKPNDNQPPIATVSCDGTTTLCTCHNIVQPVTLDNPNNICYVNSTYCLSQSAPPPDIHLVCVGQTAFCSVDNALTLITDFQVNPCNANPTSCSPDAGSSDGGGDASEGGNAPDIAPSSLICRRGVPYCGAVKVQQGVPNACDAGADYCQPHGAPYTGPVCNGYVRRGVCLQ